MVKIIPLCALALTSLISLEGPVNAGSNAQFRCAANLPGVLDRIAVFGNYTADASGGDYGVVGPLDVAALDGDLHDLDGERHLNNWSTRLGSYDASGGACTHADAVAKRTGPRPCTFRAVVSDGRGSSITITKGEGHDRDATIEVDLKAGYGMTAYARHFPNAACVFKFK